MSGAVLAIIGFFFLFLSEEALKNESIGFVFAFALVIVGLLIMSVGLYIESWRR